MSQPSYAMKKVDLLHVSNQKVVRIYYLTGHFLFKKRLVAIQNGDEKEYDRLSLQIQEIDDESANEEKERSKWLTYERMIEKKRCEGDHKKASESAQELRSAKMHDSHNKNQYNPCNRTRTMPALPFKPLRPLNLGTVYEEHVLPAPASKQPTTMVKTIKEQKIKDELKRLDKIYDPHVLNDFESDIELTLLGSFPSLPPPVAVQTIPEPKPAFISSGWEKTLQKIKDSNNKNGIPTLFHAKTSPDLSET
jgi:hypothetical protein